MPSSKGDNMSTKKKTVEEPPASHYYNIYKDSTGRLRCGEIYDNKFDLEREEEKFKRIWELLHRKTL
jgi:hypothetical protein